jgi:hypothetical protein
LVELCPEVDGDLFTPGEGFFLSSFFISRISTCIVVGAERMLHAQSHGLQCQNQQVRQKEMHLVQYTHGTCTHLKHVFLQELLEQTGYLHEAQL